MYLKYDVVRFAYGYDINNNVNNAMSTIAAKISFK